MRFAPKNPAAALAILLFTALGNVYAQDTSRPTLPQETVSLSLPPQGTSTCPTLTTGSNCIRNVPSGDATSFRNAINAATCGDTIVLVAGSTYSGNFAIPATSCSGWIEIISSALSSLPPSGNRVRPSDAADMPRISTPNGLPAIQFRPNSNHWRLIGLEITTSYVSTTREVYYLVATGETLTLQSQLPDCLIFDRIYLHGLPTANIQHGIGMDTQSIGIVDSYCDEIHHNGADSQCFLSFNGTGPFLIQNNFIQAAGENIMFGGADPHIANLVPSDITIIGNLIQKNLTWQGQAAPYNWAVKNLFELKNAQRLLLDGNVIQYTWVAAQPTALLIRSVNQSGNCMWCVVQDITVTHNIIRHAPIGISIASSESMDNTTLATQRVLVENNVLSDISSVNWGSGGRGWLFQLTSSSAPQPHDWIIEHNTGFEDGAVAFLGGKGANLSLQFNDNIGIYGTTTLAFGGILGNGVFQGKIALSTFAPECTYHEMVFITSTGTCTGSNNYCNYPSGTYWNTLTGVGFTSISGTAPNYSGNFQLRSTSPYHNAGTDGKDIGVWDWTCLNNDTEAAIAGTFVPSPTCALTGDMLPQSPANLTVTSPLGN